MKKCAWKYLNILSKIDVVMVNLDKLEGKIVRVKSLSDNGVKLVHSFPVKKLSGFNFGKAKQGFNMVANFNDIYGNVHELRMCDVHISNKVAHFFRRMLGLRIGVYVSAIFIDDYDVISGLKTFVLPPTLIHPCRENGERKIQGN